MKSYDLVVVGSGAGLSILSEGIGLGLSCALVERGKMGGTCLTRGCIPSKVLTYPADQVRAAERAARVGLSFEPPAIDWNLIARRMWSRIDESAEIDRNLGGIPDLDVYRGTGEFTGERRLRVRFADGRTEEFAAERFVLATGARAAVPPLTGLEETGFVTSDTFFGEAFPDRPWESLIMIGGGILAAEFAHIFTALGTRVSLVEMLPRLLSSEEPEIGAFVAREFRKVMDVHLDSRATAVRREGMGKVVTFEAGDNGTRGEIRAEEIFVAAGRRSNADLLAPEKAGVDLDGRGWIRVNEYLETSAPGIWAIGDAVGGHQFRHKANYDADVCAGNMFGGARERRAVDYSSIPWAVYTHPQVGHVGLTEAEAKAAGHSVYVALNPYSAVAKGFAMGFEPGEAEGGFVKLVVDESRRILGAHVVGPEAAILVQPFVYLMNTGYACPPLEGPSRDRAVPRLESEFNQGGTFMPINRSMVIHPSLNEVTAWAIGGLHPAGEPGQHRHHHDHEPGHEEA